MPMDLLRNPEPFTDSFSTLLSRDRPEAYLLMRYLLVLAALLSFAAQAALPPRAPEQLQADADSVVVGVIEAITKVEETTPKGFPEGYANTTHYLAIRVESAEKGAAASTLMVKGWTILSRPRGWAGPTGIHALSTAATGQHVRLFLRSSPDGAFEIVAPNGFEPLTLYPGEHP